MAGLAEVVNGRLLKRPERIARPDTPFAFAGFAPDGNTLTIIDRDAACELSWPGADATATETAIAEYEDKDADAAVLFEYSGAYIGMRFVSAIYLQAKDKYLLRVFACPGLPRIRRSAHS